MQCVLLNTQSYVVWNGLQYWAGYTEVSDHLVLLKDHGTDHGGVPILPKKKGGHKNFMVTRINNEIQLKKINTTLRFQRI